MFYLSKKDGGKHLTLKFQPSGCVLFIGLLEFIYITFNSLLPFQVWILQLSSFHKTRWVHLNCLSFIMPGFMIILKATLQVLRIMAISCYDQQFLGSKSWIWTSLGQQKLIITWSNLSSSIPFLLLLLHF